MSAAYEFVQRLADVAPIFTAPPGRTQEFTRQTGWAQLTCDDNQDRIGRWLDGWAVMGVMGGPVAVIDMDTRNGADVEKVRQILDALGVRIFAEVRTPSGGRHFYIAGHPDLPTVHAAAGRDGLIGLPGTEVLSFGTNVFAPGTRRPKYDGAGYEVITDNLAALANGGDPVGAEVFAGWVADNRVTRAGAETFQATATWSGVPPDTREASYLAATLENIGRRISTMTPDSGRNTTVFNSAMACGNYIAGAGMDEAAATQALLTAATGCGLVAEDGERSVMASIRSGIRNGKQRPRTVPHTPARSAPVPGSRATGTGHVPDEDRRRLLADLIEDLRQWQDLPDPTHVIAELATAATVGGDGEPNWLLMVAPPSSGKTEAVRLLDEAADARLDEVTSAGLIGWSKGKPARPIGVLSRVGSRGLITFGDLSSLLATSDRGGRDQVFGLLRKAYDGHVTRDISPPGRTEAETRLEWSGRLTVVACVTGAIDRFAAHNDALGPRWIYVRIPDRDTAAKRRASKLARRVSLTEKRAAARTAVVAVLDAARWSVPDTLPDDVADVIEDVALVTAWGRGAVPRNGYGGREIEGVPVVEEPMRLVQQLSGLARGILALGLPATAAVSTVRRVGLDSMPAARRAVLVALADGEELTTAGAGRAANLDRKVARHTLEELAAVGIVEHDRGDDERDDPTRTVHWRLSGDDGDLVAEVVRDYRRGGWDETWVSPTPPPQIRDNQDTPALGGPTLRPTPTPPESAPPAPTGRDAIWWLTGPLQSRASGVLVPTPCGLCGGDNPDYLTRLYCSPCWRVTATPEDHAPHDPERTTA